MIFVQDIDPGAETEKFLH